MPYGVHLIESSAGQAELAKHGLTTRELARAIANFQCIEGVYVGTLIGINEQGFFGSTREAWRPDQSDAFNEPLIHIPWSQMHELLAAERDEKTGELRYSERGRAGRARAGGGDSDD